MVNSCILVGKVISIERTKEDNLTDCTLKLQIERSFQETTGEYKSDTITVKCWRGIIDYFNDNYAIGKTIGISGRLHEIQESKCIVIAEKVNFLV